jgi:transposase-like protein
MEVSMAKKRKWRRHSVEFKRQVVERMKTCENIEALARELNLERKLLYTWKYQLEGRPEPRRANLGKTAEERKEDQLRQEIARLKAALGEKALETDFFRSALRRIAEHRQERIASGDAVSTRPSARGSRSKAR